MNEECNVTCTIASLYIATRRWPLQDKLELYRIVLPSCFRWFEYSEKVWALKHIYSCLPMTVSCVAWNMQLSASNCALCRSMHAWTCVLEVLSVWSWLRLLSFGIYDHVMEPAELGLLNIPCHACWRMKMMQCLMMIFNLQVWLAGCRLFLSLLAHCPQGEWVHFDSLLDLGAMLEFIKSWHSLLAPRLTWWFTKTCTE